jgi:hypothetical protein
MGGNPIQGLWASGGGMGAGRGTVTLAIANNGGSLSLEEIAVHQGAKHDAVSAAMAHVVSPRTGSSSALVRGTKRRRSNGAKAEGDLDCPTCGNKFKTLTNLRIHVRTVHEGGRDFYCLLCGKAFGQSSNLRSHIKMVHHGAKTHVCDVCCKAFGYSSDLRKHRAAVHDCVRNFKCTECSKGFGQAGNMRMHMKAIHKGTEFRCARCSLAVALSAREITERAAAGDSVDITTLECSACLTKSKADGSGPPPSNGELLGGADPADTIRSWSSAASKPAPAEGGNAEAAGTTAAVDGSAGTTEVAEQKLEAAAQSSAADGEQDTCKSPAAAAAAAAAAKCSPPAAKPPPAAVATAPSDGAISTEPPRST